jgi:class 3 adenylate cyclase
MSRWGVRRRKGCSAGRSIAQDVALAVATLVNLAPEMFTWLSNRYIEQRFVAGIVEGVERFLATRDVVPMPPSQGPPTIVFVDLSGFTRLTEERGDKAAVRTATSLQRHADAVARQRGGRLVKLLGDGALLRFSQVKRSVEAALDLVETMGRGGPCHLARSDTWPSSPVPADG